MSMFSPQAVWARSINSTGRLVIFVVLIGVISLLNSTQAKANASQISICNNAHDGTLYFIAGSRAAASEFPFEGQGWYAARPGTCMLAGRYNGERQVAFSFAVKNTQGDLIPVMTTPSTSILDRSTGLGALCGGRTEGNFGRARPAADGCADTQMPVPISFVLVTEQRFSGPDIIFNVGVRAKDGAFNLAALPPATTTLALPNFNPNKEVFPYFCNESSGRVRVTARAFSGDSFRDRAVTEDVGSRECMSLREVPEGTEIEFRLQEEGNSGAMEEVVADPDPGTFFPGQYQAGGTNRSGLPTTFSILMIGDARISIKGSFNAPRTVIGEF